MIKEVHRKIEFSPYNPTRGKDKDTSDAPTCNVNNKSHQFTFSKSCIQELSMDGKFVRLFYAPNRIIGFQIRNSVNQTEMKTWRMVRAGKTTGIYIVGIRKLLEQFNGSLKRPLYNKLPVKKYIEKEGIMEKGSVYYFVQLVENPELLKLGVGDGEE